MRFIALIILLANLLVFTYEQEHTNTSENFLNHLILVEPDIYHLYWNYNATEITCELHVKQTGVGWIGFGLSRNGGMHNSDVIVAIFGENNVRNFTDRHINNDTNVIIDKEQNWFPLLMTQDASYSIVKFTRKLRICSNITDEEDINIEIGTPHVILSWSNSFSANGDISYHGANRRSLSVPLVNRLNTEIQLNMSEIETFDFLVNRTLYSTYHTEYYCQVYKLPQSVLNLKRHVLRVETILNGYVGNVSNNDLLHHWNIYECDSDYENIYLKNNTEPNSSISEDLDPSLPYNPQWKSVFKYCSKISWVWAKGGELKLDFPEDLAYPIGGPQADFKYFVMEIHYNNPTMLKDVRDYSGVRIYTTTKYRSMEFGVFTVGVLVPPNVPNFNINIYCRHDCVDKLQNTTEATQSGHITVFGSMFHAHAAGRQAYTKLMRNGDEINYLFQNKWYDPNYQYYSFFPQRINLLKGDDIKVTCVYSSTNRGYVKGGVQNTDEMCQVFLMYYPRNPNMVRCKEVFELDTWQEFMLSLNKSGDINYIENGPLLPDQIPQSLLNANITQSLVDKIQNFETNAMRTQICQDVHGFANAILTKNLSPLKTLVPIDDHKDNSTKCSL